MTKSSTMADVHRYRGSKQRTVIETKTLEGNGTRGNPSREVTTYSDPETGAVLATADAFRKPHRVYATIGQRSTPTRDWLLALVREAWNDQSITTYENTTTTPSLWWLSHRGGDLHGPSMNKRLQGSEVEALVYALDLAPEVKR